MSTTPQGISLQNLAPGGTAIAIATAHQNQAAAAAINQTAATQQPPPPAANPPIAPRQVNSRLAKHWKYLRTTWDAIDKTVVLLTLILAVVALRPALSSADDGRRSRKAADWANDKDYREYCEQHLEVHGSCDTARDGILPPPPGFAPRIWNRFLRHHWDAKSRENGQSEALVGPAFLRQFILHLLYETWVFTLSVCTGVLLAWNLWFFTPRYWFKTLLATFVNVMLVYTVENRLALWLATLATQYLTRLRLMDPISNTLAVVFNAAISTLVSWPMEILSGLVRLLFMETLMFIGAVIGWELVGVVLELYKYVSNSSRRP